MKIGNICRTEFVSVKRSATIKEVAELMEEKNVGSVIINGSEIMFGIITDRDILIRVFNAGLDPVKTTVDDVMTENFVVTLSEDMGILEALERVKESGVRRFPVVNNKGRLIGIVTLDDIIKLLGKEMADIASIIEGQGPSL